ncbi:hypothetical protein ACFFUT_08840 [Pseudohalocynthiibacter aestuariivivens]|jgi:hypothetical protein|uniref:DUF2267 domain-containing protein n=1 Tax=Pseudohalocynthiibacter aestuariivivens TaxID=1591409 RepID=A0ABV5JFJ9_9RHOB|nr:MULTISPECIES: hypothetical protein [Pseudohalocynthiibacter]MBS9716987.1 hypothetical protein [Pseudohalocynthiibacter aestuariivivens]MCK0101914.1 hypothetical protein [Pseudohalocynthiibacter sp. F2068]
MTEEKFDSGALEGLFDLARTEKHVPSSDLIVRVLADADTEQAVCRVTSSKPSEARESRLAVVFRAIGGWPAIAGMATATVAGIWIGLSPPATLEDISSSILTGETDAYLSELLPGFDDFVAEG